MAPPCPPPRLEAGSWGGGRALRAPGWAPTTAGRRSGEPPVGGPSVAPRAMELRPGPCAVVVAVVSGDLGARPGALLGLGPCSGGRGRASPPSDLVSGSTGAEPFRREETPAQGPGRCGGGRVPRRRESMVSPPYLKHGGVGLPDSCPGGRETCAGAARNFLVSLSQAWCVQEKEVSHLRPQGPGRWAALRAEAGASEWGETGWREAPSQAVRLGTSGPCPPGPPPPAARCPGPGQHSQRPL